MLKEFRVKGFKNFAKELVMDFTARDYDFNTDAVKNGIVKDCMVYGPNGCGKSNLGYAIFDIVLNLTDKEKGIRHYFPYLNLDKTEIATFSYLFCFDGIDIEYSYEKVDVEFIVAEELKIAGKTVIKRTRLGNGEDVTVDLDGISNVNTAIYDGKISFVKYVYRSVSMDLKKRESSVFNKFINFVEHMLFVHSLKDRGYIGFMNGSENLDEAIIKTKNVENFQKFLKRHFVDSKLVAGTPSDIYWKYKNGVARFHDVASTGTKELELLFYWILKFKGVSFLFIDEYDAFYHSDVSEKIIEELKKYKEMQCVLTTHNTDCMNNDLLRPDCYYVLDKNVIKALPDLTEKELRFAHNLQKMYVAGAFSK